MQNAFAAIGIDLKTIRHRRPTCPQCGHKGTLWVDLVGGGYHCHSASCDFSGNVNSGNVSTDPSRPKLSLEEMARQEAERQRNQDTNHERAARVARETYANLSPVGEHPYLTRKKIPPIGIRFGLDRHSPFIAIPAKDVDGEWRGLQKLWDKWWLDEDGEKTTDRKFALGTAKKGAMHVLGELSDSATIAITEGYANSASLHQSDPSITAVTAFDAENLKPVALAIRAKYPNARIILVADNDIRQPDAKHQKNDGLIKAAEAALIVGGWLAVPELAGRKCDISDVWCEAGAAGVLACLQSARPAVEAAPTAQPLPELPTAIEAAKVLGKTLKDFFAAPGRVSLGIKAAAGLGKTTVALKLALDNQLVADCYVPTHELASEAVNRLPYDVAIAIRGRTHGDKENAPLCEKWETAEALQGAGFGRSQQSFLCGKGKRPSCPHAANCGYLAQFKSTAPIRFYPHQWLGIGLGENKPQRSADVAIVDETFSDALEEHRQWKLSDLSEAGGIFYEIGDAIRNGELSKEAHLLKIVMALASEPDGISLQIHAEMTAFEAKRTFYKWLEQHKGEVREPWDLLKCAKVVLENNEPLRLFAETKKGETTIRYGGRKPLYAGAPKWLFLDASLNPAIVKKLKPDAEIATIEAQRNVFLVQIRDRALGKDRLAENKLHLEARIGELVERLKASNPNGAVIAPLKFLTLAKANGHFSDLPTAHYNALRGLNTLEKADWLVQVGRNEPPPYAVENSARSWFADDPTLQLGTVERVPGELIDAAGRVYVTKEQTRFRDSICQGILESKREQESLQGVDRLRLVHAQRTKTIYLLSNQSLPGLRPDVVVTLDELLLPGRLAVAMRRDNGVLLGASMLAQRYPDLWKYERDTKADFEQLKGGKSLYISLIGNSHPLEAVALREVTYRTEGQRGSDRKAYLYAGVDAQAVLDKIHGAPVAIKEIREPASVAAPIGNMAALFPGGFDASDYEPLNELEFEDVQDGRWPDTPLGRCEQWEVAL